MGLKFLHISDIHFQSYNGRDYIDLDSEIQLEIQHDLEALKKEYSTINGFLIGGDIAFSGRKEQYEKADRWIQEICKIIGCEIENVFTVPGNHDVNSGKIDPLSPFQIDPLKNDFKKGPKKSLLRGLKKQVKNCCFVKQK